MDETLLQLLMNFGLGAVFAGVMFIVYRETIKQMREDRKYMQDCLKDVVDRYDDSLRQNTAAQVKHSEIQGELFTWLKARNGHN